MSDDPKTQTVERCKRIGACASIAGLLIVAAITPLAATTAMPEWLRASATTIGALLVIIGVIYGAASLVIRSQPQLVYVHPDVDGLRVRVGAAEDVLAAVIRSINQRPHQQQRPIKKSVPPARDRDALTMTEYADAIQLGRDLERNRPRPDTA